MHARCFGATQKAEMERATISTAEGKSRLNRAEAAAFLGKSPSTVKRWVREGKLPEYGGRHCRKWFAREDLVAFELGQKIETAAPEVFAQGFAEEKRRQAVKDFLRPLVMEIVAEAGPMANGPWQMADGRTEKGSKL